MHTVLRWQFWMVFPLLSHAALKFLGTFRMDTGDPSSAEVDLCRRVFEFEHIAVISRTDDFSCYANFGSLLYNLAIPMFVHLVSCPDAKLSKTIFYVRDLGYATRGLTYLLPQLNLEFAEWVPQCYGDCANAHAYPTMAPPKAMPLVVFSASHAQYIVRYSSNATFAQHFRPAVKRFLVPIFQSASPDASPPLGLTLIHRSSWGKSHGNERRSMLNADEVVNAVQRFAEKYGLKYSGVDFRPQSLLKDVRLMQSTYVLVGQHGAGLHNCLFMRPGTFVVELSRAWRFGYRSIFWPSVACSMLRDIRYYAFEEDVWAECFLERDGCHHPVNSSGLEAFLVRHVADTDRLACFQSGTGLNWDVCCSRVHGEKIRRLCWAGLDAYGYSYQYCC